MGTKRYSLAIAQASRQVWCQPDRTHMLKFNVPIELPKAAETAFSAIN
jgi:hypothetical protein